MPSPGYVNPNTPKGFTKARRRFFRDLKRHGKPTSRTWHDARHRVWLRYLEEKGQRS